jgi:hypothetical protein
MVYLPFSATEVVTLQWAEWRRPQSLDGMSIQVVPRTQASICGGHAGVKTSKSDVSGPVQAASSATVHVPSPTGNAQVVLGPHDHVHAPQALFFLSLSCSSGKTSAIL